MQYNVNKVASSRIYILLLAHNHEFTVRLLKLSFPFQRRSIVVLPTTLACKHVFEVIDGSIDAYSYPSAMRLRWFTVKVTPRMIESSAIPSSSRLSSTLCVLV